MSLRSKMIRKKPSPAKEPLHWIGDSRNFFQDVIDETIKGLRAHDVINKRWLAKLRLLWHEKYTPEQRKPKSTPVPPPAPKRKPPSRKRNRPAAAPASRAKKRNLHLSDDENGDMSAVDDDDIVVNRICVPRIRPQWECRRFDLRVPARVVKDNLIEPLLDWELLTDIMEAPLNVGTNIFQRRVDEMLQTL